MRNLLSVALFDGVKSALHLRGWRWIRVRAELGQARLHGDRPSAHILRNGHDADI